MNTQAFELDVSKKSLKMPTLILGQGDKNGTTLQVSLFDNGESFNLSGYSVRFSMKLPDREHFYATGGTASGSVATFTIDETYAAAVSGTTDVAYVEVLSGSTVIASTGRIHVVVLEGASTGASLGESYSDELTEALGAAGEAAANANGKASAANEAAGRANSAADEVEAFLEGFTVEYSNLSQECKDTIAQAAGTGASVITDEQGIAMVDDMAGVIASGREAGTLTDAQGLAIVDEIFI